MVEREILNNVDIAIVGLYFVVILGIGIKQMFRKNRNTVEGYFLAGKHMYFLPVGASLFASNIGSEHFIGLAGTGAASGLGVASFEFNALILLQLLGFVFVPVFIASKVRTLPEYMVKRFGGSRISTYLAVLSLILYIFTKISVDLYSGAIFVQQALDWNLYVSIGALVFITIICTLIGGLAAVIYIDVMQVAIMISGSAILLFKGLNAVGGWDNLMKSYMESTPNVTFWNADNTSVCGFPREDAWTMLREPVNSDIPWPGFILGQTPASIWYWCADQMMVQKALSARSLSHAQGGTILTGWLKILPMFLLVIPGMISRVLYPDTVGCIDPEICMEACGNPISCSNTAYPALVMGIMPTGLRGIMTAVMLAALMSDLTSIFNSASTLFTIDIYTQIRKNPSEREQLNVGRLFMICLAVVSIGWIPIIQQMQGGQLYIYIQSVASYLSPPIAVVYCMAISWKRMNEIGAFSGLMYGLIMGFIRMILDFSFKEPSCMLTDNRPYIVQIHYMYFAAFLFFSTAFVTAIVSLLTKPQPDHMLIRTTFATRWDKSERHDQENNENCVELEPLENKQNVLLTEDEKSKEDNKEEKALVTRLMNFISGGPEGSSVEEQHSRYQDLSNLEQSTTEKSVLYLNLVFIISISVFFFIYFSINPFSAEEIEVMRDVARNKTTTLLFHAEEL